MNGRPDGRGRPRPNKAAPHSPSPAEMQEASRRIMGNLDIVPAHEVKPTNLYVPDIATLRAASGGSLGCGGRRRDRHGTARSPYRGRPGRAA